MMTGVPAYDSKSVGPRWQGCQRRDSPPRPVPLSQNPVILSRTHSVMLSPYSVILSRSEGSVSPNDGHPPCPQTLHPQTLHPRAQGDREVPVTGSPFHS